MKKCVELKIGQTTIKKEPDYDPDTSYLGSYGDTQKPGCIIREYPDSFNCFIEDLKEDEDLPERRNNEYRFFYPPENGEQIGSVNYKKYALQDYRNMESLNNRQWGYCCIIVKTAITTDLNLSDEVISSLCGIEDHWDKGSDEYIRSEIDNLKSDVKDQLLKMGFKEEEIEQSFQDAKEINLD